jgi:hypothetical protein
LDGEPGAPGLGEGLHDLQLPPAGVVLPGGVVAHVEGVADTNQFINDSRTVTRIVETYDLIRSVALPIEDTAMLIKQIRESL